MGEEIYKVSARVGKNSHPSVVWVDSHGQTYAHVCVDGDGMATVTWRERAGLVQHTARMPVAMVFEYAMHILRHEQYAPLCRKEES